jgi:hypothetical protein
MENTIYPHVFKGLMKRQNIKQLELADRSRVGIATIKRICSGKGAPKGCQWHCKIPHYWQSKIPHFCVSAFSCCLMHGASFFGWPPAPFRHLGRRRR